MLTVSIITPERTLPSYQAVHVTLTAVDGQLGIRPGHAHIVAQLATGMALVRGADGRETILAIRGGIAQVLKDQVRLFVEAAVVAEDIDHVTVQKRLDQLIGGSTTQVVEVAAHNREVAWLKLQTGLAATKKTG